MIETDFYDIFLEILLSSYKTIVYIFIMLNLRLDNALLEYYIGK